MGVLICDLFFIAALAMVYIFVSRRQAKAHMLVEHLASLARRSMPLQTGLRMLAQDLGGIFGGRLNRVARRLEDGASLEEALRAVPRAFPPFLASMIAMGERTGNLAGFLDEARRSYRRITELPYQSAYAMLYPLMLTLFVSGVLMGMHWGIMPKFASITAQFNLKIDYYEDMWSWLITIAQLVFALTLISVAFILMGGFSVHFRSAPRAFLKPILDRAVLAVPFLRRYVKDGSLYSFSVGCGLALRAGATLPEAVEAAGQLEPNAAIRRKYARLAAAVAQGEPLSQCGRKLGIFPADLRWFVKTGEDSGNLAEYLLMAAGHYDAKVRFAAQLAFRTAIPLFVILNGLLVFGAGYLLFLPIRTIQGGMVGW